MDQIATVVYRPHPEAAYEAQVFVGDVLRARGYGFQDAEGAWRWAEREAQRQTARTHRAG